MNVWINLSASFWTVDLNVLGLCLQESVRRGPVTMTTETLSGRVDRKRTSVFDNTIPSLPLRRSVKEKSDRRFPKGLWSITTIVSSLLQWFVYGGRIKRLFTRPYYHSPSLSVRICLPGKEKHPRFVNGACGVWIRVERLPGPPLEVTVGKCFSSWKKGDRYAFD